MALRYNLSQDGQLRASTWVEVRLLPEQVEALKKIATHYWNDPKRWKECLENHMNNYTQMGLYDQLDEVDRQQAWDAEHDIPGGNTSDS